MKYGAITLDTSAFERSGLRLEHGLLKTLEQFKDKPVGFVISEIVLRELHAHLKKKVSDTKLQVERALHECSNYLSVDAGELDVARGMIVPSEPAQDISKEKIRDFIDRTGAEIIEAESHVDISSLIKRYFQATPPFSESGNKKMSFLTR